MAFDGQPQLGRRHPAAVVGDRHEVDTAILELDRDPRRSRIDRVLDQLLQRRRGPFDDLAGGDLIDQLVGQAADRHRRP